MKPIKRLITHASQICPAALDPASHDLLPTATTPKPPLLTRPLSAADNAAFPPLRSRRRLLGHSFAATPVRCNLLLLEHSEKSLTPSSMSGTAALPQKCKLPLPVNEKKLYDLIWSKESLGIWTADMKRETGLTNSAITKALKSLHTKKIIKDVVNIHNKAKKIYMAVEFEPSKEISGGSWYADGSLDLELIRVLREQCRKHVGSLKAATVENVWQSIRDVRTECTMQRIKEIMEAMVLDREIQELTSSGVGEFSHIQAGRKCYRILRAGAGFTQGCLSPVPCGVCPRVADCSPDGIISPSTYVYYNKWLGLDF